MSQQQQPRNPHRTTFATQAPCTVARFSRLAFRTFRTVCLLGFAALSGCALNPNTGRNQLIALPAAQVAHAELGFSITTLAAVK